MHTHMGVRVPASGSSCFHRLLPDHHHSSSSSSSRSIATSGHGLALSYHIARRPQSLATTLSRAASLEYHPDSRGGQPRRRLFYLTRAFSADIESFFAGDDDDEDDFITYLQQLAMSLRGSQQDEAPLVPDSRDGTALFASSSRPPHPIVVLRPEDTYPGGDVAACVERKANSVDLPLSLRIIKQKKHKYRMADLNLFGGDQVGFGEAAAARCSVKRAFSSMVFIIRELQSYTLQLREGLQQGILARVQGELHASFVWLFQHIFACTPTLMLSLMLLLANFTVHSMAHAATSAPSQPHSFVTTVSAAADNHHHHRFVTFSSVDGRTASIGGGGGGRKARPVAGETDDGRPILPNGMSTAAPATRTAEEENRSADGAAVVTEEEEARLWNKIVEEARRMQAAWRDEALMDPEILQRLVSPVTVEMEAEDESAYLQTELMYHKALSQEPHNVLLLSNFAQFLYLVLHDQDRAEYYFKRAVRTMPADAEALSRYASFLWGARKDLGAAEENYLEAIAADPGNEYHAANYANFLWNTGGEDTCYPLDDDAH